MLLENAKFDRQKHVYENDQFAELKRLSDFAYRFASCSEETANTLYDVATVCYQPEWNTK